MGGRRDDTHISLRGKVILSAEVKRTTGFFRDNINDAFLLFKCHSKHGQCGSELSHAQYQDAAIGAKK